MNLRLLAKWLEQLAAEMRDDGEPRAEPAKLLAAADVVQRYERKKAAR